MLAYVYPLTPSVQAPPTAPASCDDVAPYHDPPYTCQQQVSKQQLWRVPLESTANSIPPFCLSHFTESRGLNFAYMSLIYWNPCRCCWCNLATVFVVLSSFYVCSTWLALVQPGSECATENGPSQPRSLGITWCDDCLLNCITIVQVGWNKCGESWMQGYCSLSCGRCPSGESYISPTLVLWTLLAHNVSKLHIFDANGAGIPWHECLFLVLSFVVYQTPSKPTHEWKACYDHTEKSKHLMHCSR